MRRPSDFLLFLLLGELDGSRCRTSDSLDACAGTVWHRKGSTSGRLVAWWAKCMAMQNSVSVLAGWYLLPLLAVTLNFANYIKLYTSVTILNNFSTLIIFSQYFPTLVHIFHMIPGSTPAEPPSPLVWAPAPAAPVPLPLAPALAPERCRRQLWLPGS